jgi:chaperonin GroEL
MNATRAAVEEGILPGGGVALLRASRALTKLRNGNDDQNAGIEIVRRAITWPARQIAINAGYQWSSPRSSKRRAMAMATTPKRASMGI